MLRTEGELRGRAEGELRGRAEVLIEQLTDKFGPLPEAAQQRIANATLEQLKTWTHRVLHATALDEALGP
jgi:predicted transposase YdaD